MNTYINKKDAINEIDSIFPPDPVSDFQQGVAVGLAMARLAITCIPSEDVIKAELPTTDVAEVVRCRDCKFYEISPNECNGNCSRQYATFYPEDFCSYGERNDNY